MHVQSLSCVWLFVAPRTVALQVPLFKGFSGKECYSRLPVPPPGDFLDPGIKPESPASPALTGRLFTTEPSGKPQCVIYSALKRKWAIKPWKIWKNLKCIKVMMVTQYCKCTKRTELSTLKWCILCYMNVASTKVHNEWFLLYKIIEMKNYL